MEQEIASRRQFFSIDRPAVQARIRYMGRMVRRELPQFVEDAVNISIRTQGIEDIDLRNRNRLINLLAKHYALILSDEFGPPLEESYHALSSALVACGQDSRLCIAAGSVVMRSILKYGARRMIWRPFEFAKCGMAMGSLFSFDVSVALHLQISEERAALLTRSGIIDSAIREFRSEVIEVTAAVQNVTNALTASCATVDSATIDTAQRSDSAVGAIADSTAILQMSSHAIEEMGASIRQISDQAVLGANLAENAVHSANESRSAMKDLTGALGNIDTITQMISMIAGQTNLLALNATIEAARAGDAGRGFAVVANEVKGLVSQVERATDDIKKILGNVRNAADGVINQMGNIGEIIGGLSGATASVSVAVQQQRQAIEEVCVHIEKVVKHNGKLEEGISALAGSSLTSAREASSLRNVSAELQARSAGLAQAFSRLAENLRAA